MLRFAHHHKLDSEGQCLQCAVFLADKKKLIFQFFCHAIKVSVSNIVLLVVITEPKRDYSIVLLLSLPSNREMLASTIFLLNMFGVVE